nr:MAG TPA: hypothetical protein [Caudoviricetes sp.]
MKANFRGVTTAHTQTGTRWAWKRRDEAQKREIARENDDKRMSSLIMSELAKEIAELRKPKPMIVKLEPEEARLALSKGSMVWATVGRKRERCWLTKAKEMYIGNIPARLAGAAEYETEIYFTEE